MSRQYDNTNTGVLFKNDRKESDRHPDYRGSINVDGAEFWLSSWIKEGKSGKFMSLSVTPKDERSQSSAPKPSAPARMEEDDDIPFANPYRGKYSYVV